MPKSVLEAIKLGQWDYEPPEVAMDVYEATDAMPGTRAKLEIMAERLRAGLPLWHPLDRQDMEADPPPKSRPKLRTTRPKPK